MRLPSLSALLSCCFLSPALSAQTSEAEGESASLSNQIDWLTGSNASLGEGLLSPHLHFQAAYGFTTADALEEFSAGHHDPATDGWTIQGFELGASLRPAEWLEAFTTYHLFKESDSNRWDGEWEEWFAKIKDIPGGFELRGGKFLSRFGLHNATHSHAWSHVDQNLLHGRLLGEHGLGMTGGELSWKAPVPWTSVFSLGIGDGRSPAHEHAHGHEEEGHAHEEHGWYEAGDAAFSDVLTTLDWTNVYERNDFHHFRFGLSGAWGKNRMDRLTQVYGVHFQYDWRENGLEPGGRYFTWQTEAMARAFGYDAAHGGAAESHEEEHEHHHGHDDHDDDSGAMASHRHRGTDREFGLLSAIAYGFDSGLELGLRAEYIEGLKHTEASERWRFSPNATWYLNPGRTAHIRAQYNYDQSPSFGDEHSVWIQFGFNWGGPEVR